MNLAKLEPFAKQGWNLSTVGDAAAIKNNLRFPISEEERVKISGDYPYFGPTGVLAHINEYRIEGEHVLIGEDGDHFLKFQDKPMTLLVSGQYNVNNHAHVIAGTKKCETKWLHYFFMHADLTPFLTRQGVGRFKLTKEALSKTPLLLPHISEQRKIADILTTWDEALTQLDALIDAQERRKKALMQQLLTGRRRLKGFTDRWKPCRFGDFLVESRMPGNDGSNANKLTVRLYGRGVIQKKERLAGSENTRYYQRKMGQFIYSKLDFLNGAFGIIPGSLDGYESTLDVPAFDFRPTVNSKWLLHFVCREEFYSQQLSAAAGGRKARRVNPSDFLAMKLLAPSLDEQRQIAVLLDTADQQLILLRTQRTALDQQKRGLMQRLLTGKLRVSV